MQLPLTIIQIKKLCQPVFQNQFVRLLMTSLLQMQHRRTLEFNNEVSVTTPLKREEPNAGLWYRPSLEEGKEMSLATMYKCVVANNT